MSSPSTLRKFIVAASDMTIKNNLTYGVSAGSGCSGIITAIPRLNFPGLCLSDAGNGVRGTDFVNGYPSGLHVGASWNRDLAKARAVAMGGEFRTKGVHVALGPVVGPLGRVAEGGRNWEGFSNDPYLCGTLAADTVTGIQSVGVITSTKVCSSLTRDKVSCRHFDVALHWQRARIEPQSFHYCWGDNGISVIKHRRQSHA